MKIFLLISLCLAGFLPCIGQNFPDSNLISQDHICQHIEILASDEFEGRKPGRIGEEKTLAYLQKECESIGLEPGYRGSWHQEVKLREFTTLAPETIQLKTAGDDIRLTHREDYYLGSTKEDDAISIDAPVVFAGFGISAPELDWDDYGNLDLKGKIVIVLSDSPDQYTTDTALWKGDSGANLYGQLFYKKNEAAKRGALGLFVIFRDKGPGQLNWSFLDRYAGQPKMSLPEPEGESALSFSGYLKREAAEKILSSTGHTIMDLQAKATERAFKPIDLKCRMQFQFSNSHRDLISRNFFALKKGKTRPEEVIIYSAHWDHEGINRAVDGDSIYNGAVDNASGTSMLLEVARAYSGLETERSILFFATTAEEMGLLGAIAYNRDPAYPHAKTVADFNMDAHFPYGRTGVAVGVVYGRSDLDQYIDIAAAYNNRLVIPNPTNAETSVFFRSDHYPFVEKGIPSTFLVGGGLPWDLTEEEHQLKMAEYMGKYHQPSDEYSEGFDCRGIAQDARLVFYAGWQLANNDVFPQWHQNQPFHKLRQESRGKSAWFKNATNTHFPIMVTQGRSMDARPVDVDMDGDPDLIIANEHAFNILLINDGKGNFTDASAERLPMKARDSEDIAIGDFDNDGDPDIIFVSEDDEENEFYLNDGKGYFSDASARLFLKGTSNAIATADLNGDGFIDLVIGNAGQNFCLINKGNGFFQDETSQRLPVSDKTTQDLEFADIDGDGDLDLIEANEDDSALLINDGKGIFRDETSQRLPIVAGAWETREADFGDIDGDGDPDLFFANVNFRQNKDAQNRLFLNNGEGKFTDVTESHLPTEIMHSVDGDFYDLNRDGHLDILVGNGFGHSYQAYLNDGKGKFRNATDEVIPHDVKGDGIDMEMADFNGDGIPDLYLSNFRGHDYLLFGLEKPVNGSSEAVESSKTRGNPTGSMEKQ